MTNPDKPMTSLDLVDTEDLIKELKKRHCAIVFLGLKTYHSKGADIFSGAYLGGIHICLGMLVDSIEKVKRDLVDSDHQQDIEP